MTKRAIRFTAEWCQPCKAYAPMFNKVAESREDWQFETFDVDKNSDVAEQYGIRSIPTTILEVDGKMLAKYTGVVSDLEAKLNEWK